MRSGSNRGSGAPHRRRALLVGMVLGFSVVHGVPAPAVAQQAGPPTEADSARPSPGTAAPQSATRGGPPAGVYVIDPAASDDIEAAIDRAASQVSWVIRTFARSRLRGANRPVDRIEVRYPADSVAITHDDDAPIVTLAGGPVIRWQRPDEDEVVDLETVMGSGTVRRRFISDDGEKEMLYRARPEGGLALEVTVRSSRLKEPLRYTLLFRRQ